MLNELVRQEVGVIIMSSEVEEVFNMSDTVMILKEGNAVFTCDTDEFDIKKLQLYM